MQADLHHGLLEAVWCRTAGILESRAGNHTFFIMVRGDELGLERFDIVATALGEGPAAPGGCVSGRRELVAMCRQCGRPYRSSNTAAPVIIAGALKALDLIGATTGRRDELERNAVHWRVRLEEAG
jgi:7-keto-8-aminopelargonate synthetase-like enzyme